jgi:hypothetical protein
MSCQQARFNLLAVVSSPKVVAELLTILCFREVLNSNLGLETGNPD